MFLGKIINFNFNFSSALCKCPIRPLYKMALSIKCDVMENFIFYIYIESDVEKKRIIYRGLRIMYCVFLCEKGIDEYYMSINIIYKFSHKNMWKVLYYIFILNAEIGFSCFVIYKSIFFCSKKRIFFPRFLFAI